MQNQTNTSEILSSASLTDLFGEPIHTYTRAQAIEDGMLVDVSDTAKEAGFSIPVVLTAAAWADCVEWTSKDSARQTHQDEAGRLWDVLWMASCAARRHAGKGEVDFQFYRVPRGGRGHMARLATLIMKIGFDDDGAPCITIMQPHED